jgi:hypothetical protein
MVRSELGSENMKRSISTDRIQKMHDFVLKTDGDLVDSELVTTFVRSALWHNLAPKARRLSQIVT